MSATHVWKIRLEKVRIGDEHGVRLDRIIASPEEIGDKPPRGCIRAYAARYDAIARIAASMMREIEDDE